MKHTLYKLFLTSGAMFLTTLLHAQDEGFIYGKVSMEDGKTYEGLIRWGKEEVYWNDIFNASKERNDNLRYLSAHDRERLDDRHYEWFTWDNRFARWFSDRELNDNDHDYVHQFSCQFGEIKSLRPISRRYAEIEFRNGTVMEVNGEGYNDIDATIHVSDPELGEAELYWGRIEKIEFMDTPSRLGQKFGKPLYGTVEAFGDKFTGYIQWDHDERLSTDKLDGDSDDGDLSIEFGKVRSIERRGGRSLVVLRSGREIFLHGSNDVSSGHRGVIVMNKDFTAIDIPWSEFDKVVFEEKAPEPVATYSQFGAQKELEGKVTSGNGKIYSGKIVFDLDETFNFELLQGKAGEFEYTVAFRNIKRINKKSDYSCTVELTSGKKINLDDAQDVNEKNQGVLVFIRGQEDPAYIPWYDIREIEFK